MKYGQMNRAGDWIGREVVAIRPIRNNGGTGVAPGTRGRVTDARGGLHITFEACSKCQSVLHVRKVDYDDVAVAGPEPGPYDHYTELQRAIAESYEHETGFELQDDRDDDVALGPISDDDFSALVHRQLNWFYDWSREALTRVTKTQLRFAQDVTTGPEK